MKIMTSICLFMIGLILSMPTTNVHASTQIQITPSKIYQGDPIIITVPGIGVKNVKNGTIVSTTLGAIKGATTNVTAGSKLSFFDYNNSATALYGIDLNHAVGTSTVIVKFADGSQATTSFYVNVLPRPSEFLAVPAQLGGNSTTNQAKIVSILNKENTNLASFISRANMILWAKSGTSTSGTNAFLFPVASSTKNPFRITDPYGYSRDSGSQTIVHKGVDFAAPVGTPVYAISDGTVLATKKYITYGNTVILDHGLGLISMYMHLSKTAVLAKQSIKKGQLIGYSGETGYSEGPHLHLTIRINGISIDPMRFYSLFGNANIRTN